MICQIAQIHLSLIASVHKPQARKTTEAKGKHWLVARPIFPSGAIWLTYQSCSFERDKQLYLIARSLATYQQINIESQSYGSSKKTSHESAPNIQFSFKFDSKPVKSKLSFFCEPVMWPKVFSNLFNFWDIIARYQNSLKTLLNYQKVFSTQSMKGFSFLQTTVNGLNLLCP